MDRRDFLRNAGQGALLAGLGMTIAAEAHAKRRVAMADPHAPRTGGLVKEGQAIGIGMIGVGGMGGGHHEDLLNREKNGESLQVRAVCDVWRRRQVSRQKMAKDIVGRDIEAYYDYMELLARDDIDAVVIATPDHWHAKISIDAMNAGKDVYCQKPVTLTVEESVEVRDTANATGRMFQCGAQNSSDDFYWQARKFIKNGGIGKVLYAQADYSRNSGSPESPQGGEWNWDIDPNAGPDKSGEDHIDWEQWLGPAKKRPWNAHHFFQFRKYWDYSGGIATDLLYHLAAPLTIALDVSAPERATGSGGIYVQHDDREVPDTFFINCDYPEDCSIIFTSSMANSDGNPLVIRGHFASIRKHENGMEVTAESQFKEWFIKEYGAEKIVVPKEPRDEHMTNWLKAIRSREGLHCTAETAYRAQATVKMGVESYRQDKVLFWDNAAERYVKRHPRPNRDSKYPREGA